MSRSKGKSLAPISFASLHESDEEIDTQDKEDTQHPSLLSLKDVNFNVQKPVELQSSVTSPQEIAIKFKQEINKSRKKLATTNNKVESLVKKKEVADHPLAHNSSSSSLSSIEEEHNQPVTMMKKSNDVQHAVPSINSQPVQMHESKPKLTEALFNPKARSQLFTNLKKNIHYYTGANHEGQEFKRFQYARMMKGNQDSDMDKSDSSPSLGDSKLLKDFKEKVSELKKAWDEPLKTEFHADKDSSEAIKRLRSSSDSNMALSNAESRMSNPRNEVESTLMSFSQLLAVKQGQKDDTVSIYSNLSEEFATASNEETKSEPKQESLVEISSKEIVESPCYKMHKHSASSSYVSLQSVVFLSFFVYLYFTVPLPRIYTVYINAFVFGVIFAVGFLFVFAASSNQIPVKIDRPYVNCNIPHKIPLSVYDPAKSYKGWMNELSSYDAETYHVSHTYSVYVTLECTTLRLQTPRKNISRRETFEEERVPLSNVIYQRILDISHAKVYLLPPGLVKKRVWSKKYPICVEVPIESGDSKKKQANTSLAELSDHDSDEGPATTQQIFLFGRTQPQKEEWFYRIQRAIRLANLKEAEKNKTKFSDDEEVEILDMDSIYVSPKLNSPTAEMRKYYTYMCRLLPDPNVYKQQVSNLTDNKLVLPVANTSAVHFSSHETSTPVVLSQPRFKSKELSDNGEPGLEVAWFNAFIGRIMFDFFRSDKWAKWVSVKIQKKLDKIKLPYFINGLQLTDIDLGMTVPLIHKVSLPRIDEKGTWLEMEITYNGSIQLTLETKCVLTKLGKKTQEEEMIERPLHHGVERSAITNSDEEDSAESSDEEESAVSRIVSQVQNVVANVGPTEGALATPIQYLTSSSSDNVLSEKKLKTEKAKTDTYIPPSTPVSPGNAGTAQQGKRWMRIVDSITKNKYFQKATETKYIRKKLETVSNTPLVLTAELQQLHGSMSVNIPPPPTDRIWYGFTECPFMVLKAHPKFGERAVTMTHVTDWIAKKLKQEFNKVLVMPNMEDIPIPVMYSNITPT